MRYSKQREEILELVRNTQSHPTADWVYDQVRKTIPNVSLGTVYRNLGQLVETKAVKALKYDGMVHYDGNMVEHQHFCCQVCGNIYDIDIDVNSLLDQVVKHTRHQVTDFQFHFVGVCNNCQHNIN